MRINCAIPFLIYFIFLFFSYGYALENKILLQINNKIITSLDLLNEMKILKLLNNNVGDLSNEEIIEIATKSLTKQSIKETELLKHSKKLELPKEYLNTYLINYSKKLNFSSKEDFFKYCEINFIDIDAVKKKITIELLWSQLIYQKFSKNLKIDKNKIEKNIAKKKFTNEYLLSEILFNVENKKNISDKFDKIKQSINENGFEKTALNFSISDTSQKGGLLGWIKETSLSPKVKNIIKNIKSSDFTDPIQVPGGFLILFVKDIRKVKNNLNIDEEIDNIIRSKTNKQLSQFSIIFLNKIKKDLIINEF